MNAGRTLAAAALAAALVGCSSTSGGGTPARDTGAPSVASATERAAAPGAEQEYVPYDVRPLLAPKRKYLGVAIDGAPKSPAVLARYARTIGKQPNVVEHYVAWGDRYDAAGVQGAWSTGALSMIAWEPFTPSVSAIADGASDDYIRRFAGDVRGLNLPVALSIGHEMNGHWYPWGTRTTSAADFVRAWRHVHDLFLDVGATTVIWVWSPNVVNPVPGVALRPLYPGDAYVDWVGVTGYYTTRGQHTYASLFGATLRQVRGFTRRPVLIAETGAEQGGRKAADIADLFRGVAAARDVVGLVWFEYRKRADWRVTADPVALAAYRRQVTDPLFGFDPKQP